MYNSACLTHTDTSCAWSQIQKRGRELVQKKKTGKNLDNRVPPRPLFFFSFSFLKIPGSTPGRHVSHTQTRPDFLYVESACLIHRDRHVLTYYTWRRHVPYKKTPPVRGGLRVSYTETLPFNCLLGVPPLWLGRGDITVLVLILADGCGAGLRVKDGTQSRQSTLGINPPPPRFYLSLS